MKITTVLLFSLIMFSMGLHAQENNETLPVRGFCIGAPNQQNVDRFVKFINEELAPRDVNTLVLRVDYDYQFKSHPELADENGLTEKDVKKLVTACKQNNIRLIPQINMLGHQSWAGHTGKLLSVYPEFDETPWVKMPEKYEWPNEDGLYCKSYCTLHPDLHKILFDIIDEICDVFEADAFHAGMDEVFYIGEDKCPRCGGRDKAELFAGEVNTLQNHLAQENRQLWIWGDRLIDGKTTGMGMWEASMNTTYRAIDLISKDVMICDWHYDQPHKTPVLFALKGLSVISCPWKNAESARVQAQDMLHFRQQTTHELQPRFAGVMQTVWNSANSFLDEFYSEKSGNESESNCFRALFEEIKKQ